MVIKGGGVWEMVEVIRIFIVKSGDLKLRRRSKDMAAASGGGGGNGWKKIGVVSRKVV